ncbi:MAG: RNA polymerase sigma factor [Bacteroidetes bacterium]|nr:RNA polymerase sigma factor [Bacteroidota bacterium]
MTAIDFSALLLTQNDALNAYAVALTGSREDARDLAQDTVLRALNNIDKFQPGTNVRAWTYTIMRNLFINNYRVENRFRWAQDVTESSFHFTASGQVEHNAGYQRLLERDVLQAIQELPDHLRIPFELSYHGHRYNEIAEIMDQPLGTVKSRIHAARKNLAKKITAGKN